MSSPLYRRYAQAYMTQAAEAGALETADADVAVLQNLLKESREFRQFIASPLFKAEKKASVMQNLLNGHVSAQTLTFVHFLIEKGRIEHLSAILGAYVLARDTQAGTVVAHVKTATALDDSARTALISKLETLTGRNIRLDVQTDSSLIGGMVVRVGDTVYDGSVRHHLERLQERLIHGTPSMN